MVPPNEPAPASTAAAGDSAQTLKPHDRPMAARQAQRMIVRALPALLRLRRRALETRRRWKGERHHIDFFHQVDDPYSELALQAIDAIRPLYDVEFEFHLVSRTDADFAPEPELLYAYARRDCALVAPTYGLDFPANAPPPSPHQIERIEKMLAGAEDSETFLARGLEAGRALWRGDEATLRALESEVASVGGPSLSTRRQDRLQAGNALREKEGHYSGAMLRYANEWFWGVDRLYHLERRLIELGAAQAGLAHPRFDRPSVVPTLARVGRTAAQPDGDDSSNETTRAERAVSPDAAQSVPLRLEIFPSLRSPYTAFAFERSVRVARELRVEVDVRPVLPMVMRGVPVPKSKALYIIADAHREAAELGEAFGNMLDPIGQPVERGFSLWPFARDRGKGAEYVAAFLRTAFAEGQPVGTDEALKRILEQIGLSFEEARSSLDSEAWREEVETNRLEMYEELGLWGVPAYRLSGGQTAEGKQEEDLCVWGQDRLWLIVQEILRRRDPTPSSDPSSD